MDLGFICDLCFLALYQLKGISVYFGYSCRGSTGTSKQRGLWFIFAISSFSLSSSVITTHECSYVFLIFLYYKIYDFIGRQGKTCKIGKIFGNFNSCFREYINNTNYMYILADKEEEGLSYYQMRQPGTI